MVNMSNGSDIANVDSLSCGHAKHPEMTVANEQKAAKMTLAVKLRQALYDNVSQ